MMRLLRLVLLSCGLLVLPCMAWGGFWDDVLGSTGTAKQVQAYVPMASGISNDEVVAGLKEALVQGTSRTVGRIGRADAFWRNDLLRIPLPDSLQRPAKLLRQAGMGSGADDLLERMNRAAENAVPLARPIFGNAIKQMTFADVNAIWKGPDDAATRYFEKKTTNPLTQAFAPIVHGELEKVGAVRSWRQFSTQYGDLPFVGGYLNDDLDAYVTQKALAAMFLVLAQEEGKIRRDPAARTTELLKKVFASQ